MINKKIVFFDVDGTLLNKDKVMSSKTVQAIQRLRTKGHYAVLCTGRSCNYLKHILQIGFDGYICCGGAYTVFDNKVIDCNYLATPLVKKIETSFNSHGVAYDHECIGVDYLTSNMFDKMFDNQDSSINQMQIKQFKMENTIDSMNNYKGEPVLKISYFADNTNQLEEATEILKSDFKISVNPLFSDRHICGDLILNGIDKGTAINKLIQYLNIDIQDTICFGDSMNDIEMFKTCHERIAMGNSSEEIKINSTAICETVDNDGIYHELLRRNLI